MKGACRWLILIQMHLTNPTKTTRIRALLLKDAQDNFKAFLQRNADIVAWSHEYMPDIDLSMIAHWLIIDPKYHPVKQKRRAFNSECYEAIKVKVNKLLKADFISSVDYLTWLSNVVLVKKANEQWWVCGFTNLNKACPKDCFPLPRIDQLVNATTGHQLLSFIDAYSSYN